MYNTPLSDGSRTSLVTQFVCTICGNYLSISYDGHLPTRDGGDNTLTGSSKVDNLVRVHPCKTCYGKAVEPIESMRRALGI